jgi:light-regulated signal transduction histidine kinase (bacteriophytochrome)
VARIVERHHRRAWAESQPDAGAAFYFTVAPGAERPVIPKERRAA